MKTDHAPQILVVDDEPPVQQLLSNILKSEGYDVIAAGTAEEGCRLLSSRDFDVVFSDLSLPGMSGIDILNYLRENGPGTPGIIVTGSGSHETAIEALRAGAFDYITKPFRPSDISGVARQAIAKSQKKASPPPAAAPRARRSKELIGKSETMRELNALIECVASSNATVLIRGESGAGKELVARALHRQSPRADRPLIPVNCGAIPEELLESELFGHVKGSFTGAICDRLGRFVLADKGTIFLDEIGDMSPKLQVKVLRVLQEQELEPVGSTETIRVDVRVLAATNVDLERAVREKRFREDLYYRLNVIPVEIPPLRARTDDLPVLIRHFIKVFNRNSRRPIQEFAPETIRILQESDWPGNVRELENLVERMSILAKGTVVLPEDLPAKFRQTRRPPAAAAPGHAQAAQTPPPRPIEAEGLNLDERQWLRSAPNAPEPPADFPDADPPAPSPGVADAEDSVREGTAGLVPALALSADGIDLNAAVDEFEQGLIFQALRMSKGIKSRAAQLLGIKRTTLVEKMKKKNLVYQG